MSFVHRTVNALRERGFRRTMADARYHLSGVMSGLYPSQNIYTEDWDLLIVLDACRYDMMLGVADQFEFINHVGSINSVGSKTTEWMEKTFVEDYRDDMSETAYVCSNPNSEKFLDPNNFKLLDEVWKYSWDEEIGTIHPRPVTDRAINAGRNSDANRIIAHYMQPHEPFLSKPDLGGREVADRIEESAEGDRSVWKQLEEGKISKEEVMDNYNINLALVLEDVELLLENISAEQVVITSDHGNALGEWGLYGHPRHRPIPSLRKVPWVETSATDERGYEPKTDKGNTNANQVEDRLKDLGYV